MNFQTKTGLHKWVEVSVGVSMPRHFLEGNGRGKKTPDISHSYIVIIHEDLSKPCYYHLNLK